jgi:hypothetical protein
MKSVLHSRSDQVVLLISYLEAERIALMTRLAESDNPATSIRLTEIELILAGLSLESFYCSRLSTDYDD